MGHRKYVSPSMHPDDPDSPHFDLAGSKTHDADDEQAHRDNAPNTAGDS